MCSGSSLCEVQGLEEEVGTDLARWEWRWDILKACSEHLIFSWMRKGHREAFWFCFFSPASYWSDPRGQPMPVLGSCRARDRITCGTGPCVGTQVPWGMPGPVVPKPWEWPHPPKPNEALWLKGPVRCVLAIYTHPMQEQGKTRD